MSSTQYPLIKWAQRKDRLFITINVVHSKKPIIEIKGKKMKYEGTDGTKNYSFEIELYDEIDVDNSKYTLDTRNIFLKLKKKKEGDYWPRLLLDKKKYHWIEIDWNYFVDDEDDENEVKEPDFEGQNLNDINNNLKDKKDNKENNENNENIDDEDKLADISDLDREEE